MNLCFISYEYPPHILGGAGTYAKTLVDGLKGSGVDTCIITNGDKHDFKNKIYRVSSPDISYWRRLFFMKRALNFLQDLNEIYDFDIIHFNEPHFIYSKLKIPTVSSIHSNQLNELMISCANNFHTIKDIQDLLIKNTVGSLSDLITVHNTEKIICPSPHLAQLIKRCYFVDENKVHFIPNGIDLLSFDNIIDYDEKTILNKYNIYEDNYLFYIGRLSHLKGIHHLIDAFKDIKKLHNKIKLVITGKGNPVEELYLKNLAEHSDDIIFTGYIDSLKIKKILYSNSLAIILPSLYEGLSMVILEAMACKKSVIACDVGGNRLVIKHGKNGFLFKPGDIESLKFYINKLIEDSQLVRTMGNFSRKLVENEFTSNVMLKATLNLYEMMM